MKTLYLKPAEGRLVRDPVTRLPIPAWGVAVAAGPYWTQLRRDGDVVGTDAKAIEAAEAEFHARAREAAAPPAPEPAPAEATPAEPTSAEPAPAAAPEAEAAVVKPRRAAKE